MSFTETTISSLFVTRALVSSAFVELDRATVESASTMVKKRASGFRRCVMSC